MKISNQMQNQNFDLRKMKIKSDASEPVDMWEEFRKDPKYKTEECKSYQETSFCRYGNKCRFAHGKYELFAKTPHPKYKVKQCLPFYTYGYCLYGERCNFLHKKQEYDIKNLYYTFKLYLFDFVEKNEISRRKSSFDTDLTSDSDKLLLKKDEKMIFSSGNTCRQSIFATVRNKQRRLTVFNNIINNDLCSVTDANEKNMLTLNA